MVEVDIKERPIESSDDVVDFEGDVTVREVFRRLKLLNLDDLFHSSHDARVINNESMVAMNSTTDVRDALFFNINNELSFVASCSCGITRGNYQLNMKCPLCGTLVSSTFVDSLAHLNWLDIPLDMAPIIHPVFYWVFKRWTTVKKRTSLIDLILDPTKELPEDVKSHIKGQGFSYFHEHADEIMDFLLHIYPKTKKSKITSKVETMYLMYRTHLFARKLPILDPSLHPVSQRGKQKIIDPVSAGIVTAANNLALATNRMRYGVTKSKKGYADTKLYEIYKTYILYLSTVAKTKIGAKKAQFRRHQLGTRAHFTFRAVIVPITTPHVADELHIPWKIAVQGYKPMILNVLTKRMGMHINDALRKHLRALVKFDPVIYDILLTLIKECPYKGLPVLFGRNPCLIHGAIQLLYVTKIKTDVHDESIGMPPLICKAPNADFDGDEMFALCLFEMDEVGKFFALHPSATILSNKDMAVSDTVQPTKQSIICLNNWLMELTP